MCFVIYFDYSVQKLVMCKIQSVQTIAGTMLLAEGVRNSAFRLGISAQ